jgi:hypothetical protein
MWWNFHGWTVRLEIAANDFYAVSEWCRCSTPPHNIIKGSLSCLAVALGRGIVWYSNSSLFLLQEMQALGCWAVL